MANHPSAEKRNRQRIKRTTRNRAVKSTVRTVVKKVRVDLSAKSVEQAEQALKVAVAALNKATSKGVVHKKAASRTIGRLSAQLHKLKKSA